MIRNACPTDVDEMYAAFLSHQVIRPEQVRGFYEYRLSYEEFRRRALSGLSWVLERGRIDAYCVVCPPGFVDGFDESPYLDQLFVEHSRPIWTAGRIFDQMEWQLRGEGFEDLVTAIPQRPWCNRASVRFAGIRGFDRLDTQQSGEVALGIFWKPLK